MKWYKIKCKNCGISYFSDGSNLKTCFRCESTNIIVKQEKKKKEMICPKCNSECNRDEFDNGVCIQHGPYGCPNCGWSEYDEFDLSIQNAIKTIDGVTGIIDQYGGFIKQDNSNVKTITNKKFSKP